MHRAVFVGADDDARVELSFASGLVSTLTVSNLQISPVPEPATALLFAAGLAGVGALRRRQSPARR